MTTRPRTPQEFRDARETLGWTVKQAAVALETSEITIRRVERPVGAKTHRDPPVRLAALYEAYLAGFRPVAPVGGGDEEVSELLGV